MAKSNQNVVTPMEFVSAVEDYFGIKLRWDMAATSENTRCPKWCSDSLDIEWPRGVWLWLNPPFRNLSQWIAKCSEQARRGCLIVSVWPLSGDRNQLTTWREAHVHVVHGRLWPEVRALMLCVWDRHYANQPVRVTGLSWYKKQLTKAW